MAKKKQFRLYPNPKELQGTPGTSYIATLLNPVDHRLYDVIHHTNAYHIVAPMPNDWYEDPGVTLINYGEGYIDRHDTKEISDYGLSGEFYRSHTPGGVTKKGAGLGLVLYSGLSLAAVVASANGIYSQSEPRSDAATRWWNNQVERGYASETQHYATGMGIINVDIDEDMIGDINRLASDGYFGDEMENIDHVSITEGPDPSSVDVEVYVEGAQDIQILPASKVAASGIVIAWNTEDSDLESLMDEDLKYPPAEVISELDMETVQDPALVLALWEYLNEENATEAQKKRFLNSVPSSVIDDANPEILEMMGQQRLPFEELKGSVAANPPRAKKHSKAWKAAFGDLLDTD